MNDPPPRQSVGKLRRGRLAPREAPHLTRVVSVCVSSLPRSREFFELELHLLDQPLAALGARPNFLALHLGDPNCRCSISAVAPTSLAARLDQRAFSASVIVGKGISCRRHATTES